MIVLSLLLALFLAVVPMPYWLAWARPHWPALVLIYWIIALPHRVGLFTSFVTGLALDALVGGPLGENALNLTVIAAVCLALFQRLRNFTLLQQTLMVFVMLGIGQLIHHWVLTATRDHVPPLWLLFLPALVSAVFWPWVMVGLRWVRRSFDVV